MKNMSVKVNMVKHSMCPNVIHAAETDEVLTSITIQGCHCKNHHESEWTSGNMHPSISLLTIASFTVIRFVGSTVISLLIRSLATLRANGENGETNK
jgi:hypothetical protein